MYYKLSNIAEKGILEEEFMLPLQYDELYAPSPVINGFKEETLWVISSDNKGVISPAIWGMLPEDFSDDWNIFQNVYNTLTFRESTLITGNWLQKAFLNRRCLIIVTGFFTSMMYQGTIHPYHVKRVDGKPFCIAGVFNRLEDGFVTCSIVTCDADSFTRRIENVGSQMPLVLSADRWEEWLDIDIPEDKIRQLLQNPSVNGMEANLIAREFFHQDIVYDAMFETIDHDKLPQAVRPKAP